MKNALNRSLTVLLLVQLGLCVLSGGFSPAILFAFVLMLAAPVCFLRSMAVHGAMFLLLPIVAGSLLFPSFVFSPLFGVWIVLLVIASAICWNRMPDPLIQE